VRTENCVCLLEIARMVLAQMATCSAHIDHCVAVIGSVLRRIDALYHSDLIIAEVVVELGHWRDLHAIANLQCSALRSFGFGLCLLTAGRGVLVSASSDLRRVNYTATVAARRIKLRRSARLIARCLRYFFKGQRASVPLQPLLGDMERHHLPAV
jgi:hypothetical protein